MSTTPPISLYPSERIKETLGKISYFKSLSADAMDAIAAIAFQNHFDAGKVIYLEGEPANFVYILERGWVKATRMTRSGREQGLLFLRPIEIFGDIAVFTNTTYPGTVTALEKVDVWVIPSKDFIALIKLFPDLASGIIQKLGERVLYYINLIEDLSFRSVEARLAGSLLHNAEAHDGQLVVYRQEWTTLDEMAVRLGTVRDVLSRTLKMLENKGYLRVEKQRIVLLNPGALAECAEC